MDPRKTLDIEAKIDEKDRQRFYRWLAEMEVLTPGSVKCKIVPFGEEYKEQWTFPLNLKMNRRMGVGTIAKENDDACDSERS